MAVVEQNGAEIWGVSIIKNPDIENFEARKVKFHTRGHEMSHKDKLLALEAFKQPDWETRGSWHTQAVKWLEEAVHVQGTRSWTWSRERRKEGSWNQ
jgi:hypothetical protein